MKIEQVKTSSIIPYERNNRKHSDEQVNRIANSISEFGFNQPIVIDEKNIVLVGHGRLLAAQKLNLGKVPIIKLTGLSDTKKRAYRILDNKLQNDSTWDFESLEIELSFLKDDDFDLEAWGLEDLLPGDFSEKGDEETGGTLGSLVDRFLVPPFSILDARQGYWQERKRFWLSIGIKSEIGRGAQPGASPAFATSINKENSKYKMVKRGK